ncbi:MAG: PilZ domain-containing protein [Candidatus Omnitrophica bacterium]|nr:PilZ domain-containing protein [Candidatus Omnitrophota bacterium]
MFNEDGVRRHARIREAIPVRWRALDSDHAQEGMIRNLSISGMLLEGRVHAPLAKNGFLDIESLDMEGASFIPRRAKIMWKKSAQSDKGYFSCGLEFVALDPAVGSSLEARVEARVTSMSEGVDFNVLEKYLGNAENRT